MLAEIDFSPVLSNLPWICAFFALIALSGAISASETALFSLTRRQLNQLRQSPTASSALILHLRENPRALLSTILLTNTTANILVYSMLGVAAQRVGARSAAAGAALGVVGFFVMLIGGEIAPKLVALGISRGLAAWVAGPIWAVKQATAPVRWVLETVFIEPLTRIIGGVAPLRAHVGPEELQRLVNIGRDQNLIDERENALLHRVMDLASLRVRALMVPRVDLVALDLADGPDRLRELILNSHLKRIPVYEGSIDGIRGVILSKEFLLDPARPLTELIRPAAFVPEQASVEALLTDFRATGANFALVVDEYGGLAGVIALEDVVEAIVGPLYSPDELLDGPPARRVDDTTFTVSGAVDLTDFCRAFSLPLDERRVETLGGYIATMLERLPRQGDEIRIGGLRAVVVSMRGHRVALARVLTDEPPAPNPDLARLLQDAGGGKSDGTEFGSPVS